MDNKIKLSLPLKSNYQTIARLTIASFANIQGFDLEAIEDLKVSISECMNIIRDSDRVKIDMEFEKNSLRVEVSPEGGKPLPEEKSIAKLILDSLMDQVHIEENSIIFSKEIDDDQG